EKFGGPETYAKIVRRPEKGIDGVLLGLKDAGYPTQFAELFTRWAVANLADDETQGEPPHYYGYNSPEVQNIRSSLAALNDLLPDLAQHPGDPLALLLGARVGDGAARVVRLQCDADCRLERAAGRLLHLQDHFVETVVIVIVQDDDPWPALTNVGRFIQVGA